MFRSARILLLATALGVPACHVDEEAGPTSLRARRLSGGQVVPPVASGAVGSAFLTIDQAQTAIVCSLEYAGLTDPQSAGLRLAGPGRNGPVLFELATAPFGNPLVVSLRPPDLVPAPSEGVATFGEAVEAILRGDVYAEVRTSPHPDGEIRGQVGPVGLRAVLTGAGGAAGTMSLRFDLDQASFDVVLSHSGLSNVAGAGIHAGPVGVVGPILFPLASGPFAVPLARTVIPADVAPLPAAGIATWEDAVDAILSGGTYAAVRTLANPAGEIRGRILP